MPAENGALFTANKLNQLDKELEMYTKLSLQKKF